MKDCLLRGCKLILGVTGSIAAYKTPELVRLLVREGAEVQVLASPTATRFVTAETLATVSRRPVLTDMFADHKTWTQHVALGRWADLCIIAPLSAQTLAKLSHGFADSMLAATVLAAQCPVLVCPAMDHDMYMHRAVRANLAQLAAYGYHVMDAELGELASGLTGYGRMPEPHAIVTRIKALVRRATTLAGTHALVTAGPTREPVDAVRVVTNRSTGTMGFALADALARRGAQVTLVSGPSHLKTPAGVSRVDVETAAEMASAVAAHGSADYVFMAAAVADYAPAAPSARKLKKRDRDAVRAIALAPTKDILQALGADKRPGQVLIGFAMETHDGVANARQKLKAKNLDWVVLNYVNEAGAGFGTGTNRVTLLGRDGSEERLARMPKRAVAEALLERILPASGAERSEPCA